MSPMPPPTRLSVDSVIRASPLLESLGNRAYALVLRLNRYVNPVRARLGYPYWSVAAFLKHKVKNAYCLSLLRWTEQSQLIGASASNGAARHRVRDALAA